MPNPIQIVEFEDLTTGLDDSKLSPEQFDLLKNFILSNSGKETSPVELMGVSVKKGKGEVITAKNYVGVIALNDREKTQIEILPKIYGKNASSDRKENDAVSKRVLIKMLDTIMDAPGKSVQRSNMETGRTPLYEVFVRMFLDEAFKIYRQGFKKGYSTITGNETYAKGKLLVSGQLRENLFHEERFYVEHDEFDENQAENRLLKSTLEFLGKKSRDSRNRQDIKFLLNELSDVNTSCDIEGDFKRASVAERNNVCYRTALSWCMTFLRGESFTAFAGGKYATAVLFPMDVLYERYVAKKLRQLLPREYNVCAQSQSYYLFSSPGNMFALRPDLIISNGGPTVILDTKWKLLSSGAHNYGISQGDMYQMYAYFREYHSHGKNPKVVITLYPWTKDVSEDRKERGYRFDKNPKGGRSEGEDEDNLAVAVKFVDLTLDEKEGFSGIVKYIEDELGA